MTSKEPRYEATVEWAPVSGMDKVQELIGCCLAHEPEKRPTARDISQGLQATGLGERQEEVQNYLLHRGHIIKTQNTAGRQQVMSTEKLLRVQYTLHKVSCSVFLELLYAHTITHIKINEDNILPDYGMSIYTFPVVSLH